MIEASRVERGMVQEDGPGPVVDGAPEPHFRAALVALLPVMRAQARGLTGQRDTADDLVQDTVIRALRAATRPPEEALRPWVFVILRNAWRSELRRRRRQDAVAAVPTDAVATTQPAADGVAGKDHDGEDGQADLAAALARLPPAQREALVLTAIEGVGSAEAARICGVPEGTLRARASRARAALRLTLGGAPPGGTAPGGAGPAGAPVGGTGDGVHAPSKPARDGLVASRWRDDR